jgi:hypothetical protein
MYIYRQINLHSFISTNCTSYKQARNSPSKVCVGIPLFRDFALYGKTDLCVRFVVPDCSTNAHCRLETCTCWVPENVLCCFLVFISPIYEWYYKQIQGNINVGMSDRTSAQSFRSLSFMSGKRKILSHNHNVIFRNVSIFSSFIPLTHLVSYFDTVLCNFCVVRNWYFCVK